MNTSKNIPILNIQQFEQKESLHNFYSNFLDKHIEKNIGFFHKPHKHNFFLCVLFTEGSGIHEIDFDRYSIKPGSLFFLKPGQTHYWNFDKKPKGYIFFHSQEFYDLTFSMSRLDQFPFYYSYKNPPYMELSHTDIDIIKPLFRSINREYQLSLPLKNQKLASLLNLTYIELTRLYSVYNSDKNIESRTYLNTLHILEITIEKYYKTEKSATFYANKLNISSKHLNRIVKTILDRTTTELITERVLLESKRLIIHSNNNLTQISQMVGYEDYAYFSKVFKSKTKMTPLEFKKSYTNI